MQAQFTDQVQQYESLYPELYLEEESVTYKFSPFGEDDE